MIKDILTQIPMYIIIAVIVYGVNSFQKRKISVDDSFILGKTAKIIKSEIKDHKASCSGRLNKHGQEIKANHEKIHKHDIGFALINGRLNSIDVKVGNTDKNVEGMIALIKKIRSGK